jgi:asparagine synthase (glutamine-hydrolysing)
MGTAILDVSAAGLPTFVSEDDRYVMVYNGEIYNYQEFYSRLKAMDF